MLQGTNCQIFNTSDTCIHAIWESRPDDGVPIPGMVIRMKEIPSGSVINVDSRRCNLNKRNSKMQMMVRLVPAEIPIEGGKVSLEKPYDAVYPNGLKVATVEQAYFHNELKAKSPIYLTCGERGKVMEVPHESLTEETKMAVNRNKKMIGSIPGFFRRVILRKSRDGGYGPVGSC